jgi:hypothetical protein
MVEDFIVALIAGQKLRLCSCFHGEKIHSQKPLNQSRGP